ncbi:MAG: hypothetical protein K0S41_621 [Anaerocolumna sp.]|jgi:hypothetical protein|nr:hypothetical protein [Anaerocolumna sp.]
MSLFDQIGLDMGYVLIGVAGFTLILFIVTIVALVKLGKLKKKYNKFMAGANGETLESQIIQRFSEVDELKIESKRVKTRLDRITDNLLIAYQKVGIVKYDAFKEMGGKLSFALAMLNDNNDGFILNSMHSSREGCYTYIKEIIKGESFVVLAEEEKMALDEAINSRNYMK